MYVTDGFSRKLGGSGANRNSRVFQREDGNIHCSSSSASESNHSNWRLRSHLAPKGQVKGYLVSHSSSSSGKRLYVLSRLSLGIKSPNWQNS
jgi:hypothetical protein